MQLDMHFFLVILVSSTNGIWAKVADRVEILNTPTESFDFANCVLDGGRITQ